MYFGGLEFVWSPLKKKKYNIPSDFFSATIWKLLSIWKMFKSHIWMIIITPEPFFNLKYLRKILTQLYKKHLKQWLENTDTVAKDAHAEIERKGSLAPRVWLFFALHHAVIYSNSRGISREAYRENLKYCQIRM